MNFNEWTEKYWSGSATDRDAWQASRKELEEKLAVAERKIKSFDAYVCRDEKLKIAIEELEKLANDRSPPWDNLDWRRVAKEALEKIKR